MPGPISFTLNPTTFSMDVDVKSIQVFTGGQYYIGHSTKPSQLTGQSEIVHVKYNNSAKNDRFFMVQDAVAFSFSEPVTFTGGGFDVQTVVAQNDSGTHVATWVAIIPQS